MFTPAPVEIVDAADVDQAGTLASRSGRRRLSLQVVDDRRHRRGWPATMSLIRMPSRREYRLRVGNPIVDPDARRRRGDTFGRKRRRLQEMICAWRSAGGTGSS
jgi:hypothetical protein